MSSSVVLQKVWKAATSNGVPRRCFYVSLIVGSILNLINQGDAVFVSGIVNWFKIMLTYCVPYLVCTYGAVSSDFVRQAGNES